MRFAVLPVRDERVLHRFRHRDAARQPARIRAFGQNPRPFGLDAALAQQRRQRHAGPFAAAGQAVRALHRGLAGAFPLARAVARAFEEVDARHGRETLQLVHREDERAIDEPVNRQRMRRRIQIGDAGMMAFEVQRRGRDDAVRVVQRRPAGRLLRRWGDDLPKESFGLFEMRTGAVPADGRAERARLRRGHRRGLAAGDERGADDGPEPEKPAARVVTSSGLFWEVPNRGQNCVMVALALH